MIKKHIYLSLLYVYIGFTCAHAAELHPAVAFYNTLSNTDQQKCVNKVIFNKEYQDALYRQLYKNINTDIDSTTKNTPGSSGETLTSITADHIIKLCQNDLGQAIEALVQLVNQGKKFTTYYWQVNREGKPIQSLNIAPSDLLNALNIDVGILMSPKGDFKLGDTITRTNYPHNESCSWAPYTHHQGTTYNFILNSAVRHLINDSDGKLTANPKVVYGYEITSHNCSNPTSHSNKPETYFFPGILTFKNKNEDPKPWHASKKHKIMADSVQTIASNIAEVCSGDKSFITSNISSLSSKKPDPKDECVKYAGMPLYLYLTALNVDSATNSIKPGELSKYQGATVNQVKILSAPVQISVTEIKDNFK